MDTIGYPLYAVSDICWNRCLLKIWFQQGSWKWQTYTQRIQPKENLQLLTLSPLAVNFEDRWWPMQTIWIQMKPHKMWGFVWDPNCLTFRLYISKKKMGGNKDLFAKFERKKYLKKLPSMQRVNQHMHTRIWFEQIKYLANFKEGHVQTV